MTGIRHDTSELDSPPQLAWQTAEAVQALARSTRTGHSDPDEAYQTITALAAATSALEQLLRQTGAWLRAGHQAGTLVADDGADTDELSAGTACLHDASRKASCLAQLLDITAQHLAVFTTRTVS